VNTVSVQCPAKGFAAAQAAGSYGDGALVTSPPAMKEGTGRRDVHVIKCPLCRVDVPEDKLDLTNRCQHPQCPLRKNGHPRQEDREGAAQETHAAEASAIHRC
jgi:hypothetical protein